MTLKLLTGKEYFDRIRATAIEAVVDVIHTANEVKPTYPEDHVAGMRVPKGGSSCASCKYLADNKKDCTSTYFQKWNGGPVIPGPIDEYCSDWYVHDGKIEAGGPGSGRHPDEDSDKLKQKLPEEVTALHTAAFKQALEENGGKWSSGVGARAQEILEQWMKEGKKLDAGGLGSGCNPEVGHCGRPPGTEEIKDIGESKEQSPKRLSGFRGQVQEIVARYSQQHGPQALMLSKQDSMNMMNRGYKEKTQDTVREQLFKELGFNYQQIDSLTRNMKEWKGSANSTTREAAKEILDGKPKSDIAKLWYVEHQVTVAILGEGKVKLYRGINGSQAEQLMSASRSTEGAKTLFTLKLSSANSWTDDPKVAKNFGKMYVTKKMPTKFIMTSYKTNGIFASSYAHEKEFLCMTPEKGVAMKRSGAKYVKASVQKEVVIDLTKGPNDDWLHQMRKNKTTKVAKKKIKSAIDNSQRGQFAGSQWNDIRLIGFSGPEEEGLRAMLSRIPPELFYNVNEFISAKELGIKHGRFVPETKTIMYNPRNFIFRQRFGQGPGWVQHAEMTAIHEVGHSIYESLPSEKQKEWQDCSGWINGYKQGNVPPYTEVRPGWPPGTSTWTHKPGVKFTRHYGEKNPNEDFADCFSFFLLGKGFQMEPSKRTFLENFMKDKVKEYPSVSVQSPVAAYPKQEAIRKAKSV